MSTQGNSGMVPAGMEGQRAVCQVTSTSENIPQGQGSVLHPTALTAPGALGKSSPWPANFAQGQGIVQDAFALQRLSLSSPLLPFPERL